ncbi:MAG: tetratricopeptide repeat protein [Deltaproteobacteria bacterium]|nr:tetratricopeptide repeat protein [Deltaproteobacteria bacterium]
MGEKQARKRKYFFFYCTCFLALLLIGTGCAATLSFQKRLQAGESLEKGEKLIIKGKYKKALAEYKKVLKAFPGISPGDNALFYIGLILLHPDNPQRDYEKSLISFQRIIREFPRTRLREKAKVLSYVVAELIRSKNDIKKLKESADFLQNKLRKENEKKANTLKKQLKEIEGLKEQLKKLKEIDIIIEEKKRDRE